MLPSLVNRPSTFFTLLMLDTGVPSELTTASAYLRSPVTLMLRVEVTVSRVFEAMAGRLLELSLPPRRLLILPFTNSDVPVVHFVESVLLTVLSVGNPEYVLVFPPEEIVVEPAPLLAE